MAAHRLVAKLGAGASPEPQTPGLRPGNPLVDGIARVLIALVFVHALVGKRNDFGAVAGQIAARGLPFPALLLGAAVVLLLSGSPLLISGWRSRLGAACCWWPTPRTRGADAGTAGSGTTAAGLAGWLP